jgi:hypothetical protein
MLDLPTGSHAQPSAGDVRTPVTHSVRIVVVPKAGDVSEARDHQHGLSDQDLAIAEKFLTETPAASSSEASASSARPMLFDVLRPTDIVVMKGEPGSLRAAGPTRRMFSHDDRHRDTVLRHGPKRYDRIPRDQPFEIVTVEKAAEATAAGSSVAQTRRAAREACGRRVVSDASGRARSVRVDVERPLRAPTTSNTSSFKIQGRPLTRHRVGIRPGGLSGQAAPG